jgi:hypothetical protein
MRIKRKVETVVAVILRIKIFDTNVSGLLQVLKEFSINYFHFVRVFVYIFERKTKSQRICKIHSIYAYLLKEILQILLPIWLDILKNSKESFILAVLVNELSDLNVCKEHELLDELL